MAEQNPDLQLKLNRLRELQGVRYAGASGIKPLPIGGLLGNAGVGDTPTMGSIELNKTLTGARGRILSDPVVARSADPSKLIADLERIAQGQPQESTSGVPNAFLSGAGKFLEGVGYGLNRPLALITSAAKEIADIPSGGFSANEFVSQALAKDTAPSKYIAKTGIDWVDNIIGFTADVVADPLTYVTFGAGAYAGRAGRLNLAAKAAEADNLIKAPTLLKKVNDGSIAKLGEWALDANERAVLGVRPGLSWAFGARQTIGKEGTTLAKLSEGAATAVGKPLAKVRGAIGASELPGITALQKVTTPKKIKIAGLEMYGRVAEEPAVVNRVADLASYSAGIRANAAGAFVEKKFGSQGQQLVKEIFDYEQATGRRVYEVLEKIRPAVDSAEQDLANRTRKFLDDMRAYANTTTAEFAGRRNVDAIGVAHRENYVPHTLTEDARKYVASQRWAGTSSASAIKQMLGMNVNEFTKGPGILRGRTLQQGQEWLDVPLKTNLGDGAATMAEINKISMDKLGFKWFEEDGAQYLSNYLDSIVNQSKRVAFVDRLFDYGGEAVKRLVLTKTPNTRMAKQFAKIIDGYDNLISPILRQLSDEAGDMQFILGPRLQLAQALIDLKPGGRILSDSQLDEVSDVLNATFSELQKGKNILNNSPQEIREAYQPFIERLETRLLAIGNSIATKDEVDLISNLGLRELHQRLLPDGEIPNDVLQIAENVIDAADVYFGDQLKNAPKVVQQETKRAAEQLVEAVGERDSAAAVAEALQTKSLRDRASIAQGAIDSLDEEIQKITMQRNADVYRLSGGRIRDAIADQPRRFVEVKPNRFFNAINKAGNVIKNNQRVGDTLSIYSLDEYKGMRTFLSSDGLSGYAVKEDGDLVSVFNVGRKGMGEEAVFDGIMFGGAKKLDAFDQDGFLPNLYRKYGFKEVDRLKWDPQYAPPKWKPEYGQPDVVFMQLDERVKRYVTQSDPATGGVEAGTRASGIPRKAPKDSGLPGWVPDGIRNRFDDSARGRGGVGKLRVPRSGANPVDVEIAKIERSAKGKIARRQAKIDVLKPIVDAAGSIAGQKEAWDAGAGAIYDSDIAKLSKLVKDYPPPGSAGEVTAMWASRTRDVLRSLSSNEMRLTPAEADLMRRVVKQMKGLESRLAMFEADKAIAVDMYNKVVSGEMAPKISSDILKGWEAMESLGVQMPPEIRERMFAKVQQLGTPEGASQMRKMYDSYTRFFKVTAMLSPGFIVRNSYTAAFNNFVAGVSVKETADALKFATNILRFGVDEAMNKVPRQLRGLYEQSLKVAYATGAGQSYDDILAPILSKKGGSRFLNLKPVKKWSEANETAEVAFRFALGMSSLKKGMDFDAAVGTVARYHFDYTDLSRLDEVARQFIPFWIFASRNIPLQIINQIARPSVYRMYESVERNYGLSEEEMKDYPMWLRNRSPLRLPGMGADQTLIPDLPQLDMAEQINMMSDPMRLLSQANPLIKLPVELMGNRQLWNAVPFSEKKAPVSGPWDFPAYAIDAILGRAGKSPRTGEYYTSSKTAYAIPNLLPPLAQLQRVLPKIPFTGVQLGGKDSYQSRQGSSFASYVGLPYRRVAPEEKFNELTRRQFAIRDYLSELTRRGQLEPKD